MPPNPADLTDRPDHTGRDLAEHNELDLAERVDLTGRVPPRETPKQMCHTPLAFPVRAGQPVPAGCPLGGAVGP